MKFNEKMKTSLILICVFIVIVLVKASLIQYFPSPWIFSDEQSYFGMAGKIMRGELSNISNSHMPGYPLLLSITMLLPTIEASYKAMLFLNIILSSSIIFISYILFSKVFKISSKESILFSILVSMLPQFILYNYTIMSENLYISLFYVIFVLLFLVVDESYKSKTWLWLLLGILIGFSPIVRSQSITLLLMFILLCIINMIPKFNIAPKRNFIWSSCVAVIIYLFFKIIVFPNTTSYPNLMKGYFTALLNITTDLQSAYTFIRILLGEISFLFVAVIFVPTFAAIVYMLKKDIKKEYRILYFFGIVFILGNVLLTTLHANYVFHDANIKTVYARYLDFIIPVLFAIGIVGIKEFKWLKQYLGKKIYFSYIIILLIITLAFFYEQNLFVNTFTIYIYQFVGKIYGNIIIFVLATVAIFGLRYNKDKLIIICVIVCLVFSTIPTLQRQIKFSNDTFNLYAPIGYWFDKNNIRDSAIVIDNRMTSHTVDSKDKEYLENNELDYISFYSILFWSNYYNNVLTSTINLKEHNYYVTSRLLPRKVLASSGSFVLYDKTPQSFIVLTPELLSRFANGLIAPEQDWVWMDGSGRVFIENVFIEGINQIIVEIELKGYYPPELNKDIEVFINGISAGVQKGTENKFYFIVEKDEKFSIETIEVKSKTWDVATNNYAQSGEGLGLDIKNIKLYLCDNEYSEENPGHYISNKLISWEVIENAGKLLLYNKSFKPSIIITPEMMSIYGSGFNGPEEEWNWVIGNGEALLDQIYFPDIKHAEITIELKGLWPEHLEKQVEVFINNEGIGKKSSKGNQFVFKIDKSTKFDINSIKIISNTWDPSTGGYAETDSGLGLDIKSIEINLLQ